MPINIFAIVLLGTILLGCTTEAIEEKSAKEQPCFNLTNAVSLDPEFVASMKTIYNPLQSRLEFYRTAQDLLQQNSSEITESSLYYDSCIRWTMEDGYFTSHGFDGLSRMYKTKILSPNMEKFELTPAEGDGYSRTVYTTLTDNKSYYVSTFCTNDGEMTWSIRSIHPTLPKETYNKVYEHVMELGFKKEFITEVRYDYCDLDTMDVEATTSDVFSSIISELSL